MAEKTLDNLNRMAREQYQKALSAFERNNIDYAIEMFQQCLSVEPGFLLARKYLRAAQLKRVESQGKFAGAIASAKLQPIVLKARAVIGKNPLEAMDLAETALGRDPRNSQALSLLAEAAESANLLDVTAQTLEHYIKVYPRDIKTTHWLGRTYVALTRFDQAREIFEQLLEHNPNDFDAQKGLKDASARGAMQGGGWDEAQSYRDVIKDKDEAVALEQQSRVVRAEDMIDNLIRENLAKIAADPENPVLRRELGKLYGQKGDYDRSLKYLEDLFNSEAGSDPTLEKEISEVRQKRISDKIAVKKQQQQNEPANAAAIEAEIAVLNTELAALELKNTLRLVEKYPNDLMYRYDLGVLYMKTGDTQNAIEQFQRSVGQPQRRVNSLNYLGQCFQQLGLNDLAIDQYTHAIEELPMMDGLKKEITYNLGSAYEAIGEPDKAIAEFKKIAAVDFSYRDIRTKIVRRPSETK